MPNEASTCPCTAWIRLECQLSVSLEFASVPGMRDKHRATMQAIITVRMSYEYRSRAHHRQWIRRRSRWQDDECVFYGLHGRPYMGCSYPCRCNAVWSYKEPIAPSESCYVTFWSRVRGSLLHHGSDEVSASFA